MNPKHRFFKLASLVVLLAAVTSLGGLPARAASWPDRAIRIIVPFPPGQGADIISRLIAERLSPVLGQPVIVENRPGAGSMLGSMYVARSRPDGYTLLAAGSSALAINQYLYSKLAFDPRKDFDPIVQLVAIEYVLVARPTLNVKTASELIDLARREPNKITYGSSGNGATNQLVMAQFAASTGLKLTHIPYKGSSESMTDLLAGRIDTLVESVAVISPYMKTDKIQVLGVTAAKRSPLLPDARTLEEQGVKDFDYDTWTGLVAPAGTPAAILDRVNTEVEKILKDPDVQKRINHIGMIPIGGSRDQFRAYIKSESEKWQKVVQFTGIHLD